MIETFQQTLPHGITLSCRACGQPGRPVLLFLHGFPEAAFVWDELLHHFAQPENGGYRCVAPNLRGFEQSSAPTEVPAYRAKPLVQDLTALIDAITRDSLTPGQLAGLVAHDWGGALAWSVAAQYPAILRQLAIVNAPHPATFQRELANSPSQQASSAYMNFLARPDAPELLAENDFARLWPFFTNMAADSGPMAWLDDATRQRYREVWSLGLHGPCNYYAASPLRPPTANDPGAVAVQLARERVTVNVPTLVVWGLGDTALPEALLDGLDGFVPDLRIERVPGVTHWIVHEQPQQVAALIGDFLKA
ncbi:alpha/beta fold hydrolase [Hydrogenophaga sp.]|uniref:alpha/beta fold hydrolase n=1 Tax=Hydrogenophaga sp. TaxID=1904254 RepID=UPI00272FCCF7|nr:alpha/beta fold hydrolase [Hydrogenophaga sp.]MDP2075812.1 alpha/beta fold hydrolase [Hydrogenophaga sp.]MDP3107001.1 alpha/beta fold hydrolase [Hydrogenophaga sp.]MDP3352081.1 alpha/beta fold hydrolase [Hydrogenophaga sp.]MDZ4397288.1 alpha/beta fold hydrolase [Hydrogenophaga sp.]